MGNRIAQIDPRTGRKQNKRTLTQKMKNFCQEYVRTGNACESYLFAYNSKNRGVAMAESSKLLQRDDITEYINKLNAPIVNQITNEREKKRKILWDSIERCLAKEDEPAVARYMDILNKMDAEYVNINRNIDDTGERFSELTTEQLKQLVSQ